VRLAVHAREAGAGAVERERRHQGAARGPDRDDGRHHYRKATYYKVYRWDAGKNAIVSVGGWSKLDIK